MRTCIELSFFCRNTIGGQSNHIKNQMEQEYRAARLQYAMCLNFHTRHPKHAINQKAAALALAIKIIVCTGLIHADHLYCRCSFSPNLFALNAS